MALTAGYSPRSPRTINVSMGQAPRRPDLHERFKAVVARALARPLDAQPATPVLVRDEMPSSSVALADLPADE